MLPLTEFEQAALSDIADDCEGEYPSLRALFAATRAVKREFTGSGFFTELAVDGDVAPLVMAPSPVGERMYTIEGFSGPFGFIVFLKDGFPSLIDCHYFGAETADVDFAAVRFGPWLGLR